MAPLLADTPETDGVLLRRATAARAQERPDDAAEAALRSRVRFNLDLDAHVHAREEGMWFLHIEGNPALALDRARSNLALQHELEDARLLIDAAMAAGRSGEAAPVLAWMGEEGIEVPALRLPDAAREAPE